MKVIKLPSEIVILSDNISIYVDELQVLDFRIYLWKKGISVGYMSLKDFKLRYSGKNEDCKYYHLEKRI